MPMSDAETCCSCALADARWFSLARFRLAQTSFFTIPDNKIMNTMKGSTINMSSNSSCNCSSDSKSTGKRNTSSN